MLEFEFFEFAAEGEFLFLDFGEAFAGGDVAGFEDDAKDFANAGEVFVGKREFKGAFLEEVDGGGGELVLAERRLVNDGGDGGSV